MTNPERAPGQPMTQHHHPDLRGLAAAALAVARRLQRGATLWCLAPSVPHHAQHLAVEFVHPVILGKRAFPAVAVDESGAVRILRTQAAPGDVLVCIAAPGDALCADAARRAEAWGLTRLWISPAGPPPEGCTDHALWWEAPAARGAEHAVAALSSSNSELIRTYHLLWELTQVCLEHRGLLHEQPHDDPDSPQRCVTCADDAVAVEVVSIQGGGLAEVRGPTGREVIDVTMVADVAVDDLLLAHGGAAITRIATS